MLERIQIEALYSDAQNFFSEVEQRLCDDHIGFYGFKLLNAPPIKNPKFLFVGYQPGGGSAAYECEFNRNTHLRWPENPEFATAEWDLAKRMRETFKLELLQRSVGSNLLFLRWPKAKDYRNTVPKKLRDRIESYSLEILCKIMDIVEPQNVVTIGFGSLYGDTTPDLVSSTGRVLIRRGTLCGRQAVGMLHLTGCRISRADREAIREYFAAREVTHD